jgi:hypothetical protein
VTYRKPEVPPMSEEEKAAFKEKLRTIAMSGQGMKIPRSKPRPIE